MTITLRTPLITAAREVPAIGADIPDVIDTLRLFSDCTDFSDSKGDGWEAILGICRDTMFGIPGHCTLLLRVLQLWGVEINTNSLEDRYAKLAFYAFEGFLREEVRDFMLNLMGKKAIDTRRYGCGYTPLQYQIARGGFFTRAVLRRNPDLNVSVIETYFSPDEESPTSLAMYSSWTFANWRTELDYIGVNLEDFVEKELNRGPLSKAGWISETLLALFQTQHQWGGDIPLMSSCSDCSAFLEEIVIQPYWLHLLERYKKEKDIKILSESVSLLGDKANKAVSRSLGSQEMMNKDFSAKNVSYDAEIVGNEAGIRSINPALRNVKEDAGDQIHSTHTTQSNYEHRWEEHLCMDCWLYYKRTGIRKRLIFVNAPIDTDDASEHEYSPFLFHT